METSADFVAKTILKQVRGGSIIILHQPEVGYREHTLAVLKLVLDGLREQRLRAVSLSELDRMAADARSAADSEESTTHQQQGGSTQATIGVLRM